jgi:hypothetical protein
LSYIDPQARFMLAGHRTKANEKSRSRSRGPDRQTRDWRLLETAHRPRDPETGLFSAKQTGVGTKCYK